MTGWPRASNCSSGTAVRHTRGPSPTCASALADCGLDPDAVVLTQIRDDADAERERFTGSPTIRVAGRDVVPTTDEPVQLACRVYRRRDGRISPVPDPDDLRDALRLALTTPEGAAS